jgi:hypothetical protein
LSHAGGAIFANVIELRIGEIDASTIEMTLLSVRGSAAAPAAGSLTVTGGPIGLVTANGGGALAVDIGLTRPIRRRKVTFSSR